MSYKLDLLDVNAFIQEKNLKEVTNFTEYPDPSRNYFPKDGLWSEEIFGPYGSKERMKIFAYIDLKEKFIHPAAYSIVKSSSSQISGILDNKIYCRVNDDGELEDISLDELKEMSEELKSEYTGIYFLSKNFNRINFKKIAKKDKAKEAEWIEKNKDKIFIDKWIVMPAGIRDPIVKGKRIQIPDINNYYKAIMINADGFSGLADIDSKLYQMVQVNLVMLYNTIKNMLRGKTGLLRGAMLKKRIDYSSRLVLTSSPDIPVGKVGIPLHTFILIFEPLVTFKLMKSETDFAASLLRKYLKINSENAVSVNNIDELLWYINKNPDVLSDDEKKKIREIAEDIIKTFDPVVLVKRDPAFHRNSWFAARPIIVDGHVAVLNSMDLGPLGGDCDGDTVQIVPLFTEEAKKEAIEKMNPYSSKTKIKSIVRENEKIYNISLDAMANLYYASKCK